MCLALTAGATLVYGLAGGYLFLGMSQSGMSHSAAPERRAECQHELVEAQARRTPGATAVVSGSSSLTYAQLDGRANQLAHHLQLFGVASGVPVGVHLGRSLDMAVALLAVLKVGGACVPLDPTYPPERIAYMIGDAAPAAVITSDELMRTMPSVRPAVIPLDASAGAVDSLPATPPPRGVGPGDVAYVIYTSGSTGQPKGVLLTHRGLVNHHRAAVELYGLGPGDRVLQFCSIGFDASIEELYPSWAAGATVVLRPDDLPILGRDWLAWLRDERISVVNLPTAYWHEWARDLERLGEVVPDDIRLVVVGGEKARGTALRTWLGVGGDRPRWVNAYGPTETTCMSTVYERPRDGSAPPTTADPPIGRPLRNTIVRVVDEAGEPVPAGATGELLIGGAGLARGYLNRPDLTAERFVSDVQADGGVGNGGGNGNSNGYGDGDGRSGGRRLYRTGDLVRELASGDLDYVGRVDDQVKIRGFRIECGEVEVALATHPSVAQAVVVAREDQPGDRHLVAYVLADPDAPPTAPGDLRRHLLEHLPSHMVPVTFVTLAGFPLSPNGKVDRARLPSPEPRPADPLDGHRQRPRTATEGQVAAVWSRVLGVDEVGVDEDFFEIGGHSLLAAQVISHLREELGTQTPLRAIFESPTVAGLAAAVAAESDASRSAASGSDGAGSDGSDGGGPPPLRAQPRRPGMRFPVTLAQEQMWALEATASPPGLYNVTATRRFEAVDEDALRAALAFLVDRHETLRTAFVVESGTPHQAIAPQGVIDLAVSDLTSTPPSQREAQLHACIAEQDATPLDPARAPLVRAHLYRCDPTASTFAVTFDHLICDGTSVSVFMCELETAYATLSAGGRPELPPLKIQFADFALWQRGWLTEETLNAQVEWWVQALDGVPRGPTLPFDRIPREPSRRISSTSFTVPSATYQVLQRLARRSHSSLFTVCAAAVSSVLSRLGGPSDVVLSTTLSGRQHSELEGLICMFAGVGRVRTDVSGDPTFTEVVERARTSILGMFENQDVPFFRVRQRLLPDFPSGPLEVASTLPTELAYFPSGPGSQGYELFFRGQLHPLSITLLDDGTELRAQLSYKVAFYDEATIARLADGLRAVLRTVGEEPHIRLSDLPVEQRASA